MEEGGMGPSPAPPRQGPCWESMGVQGGGPVAAPQPAPPPHLLPVFHPEPRWEGRAARPAADESKPTPGQQRGRAPEEGPSSGSETSARSHSEAPQLHAQHQDGARCLSLPASPLPPPSPPLAVLSSWGRLRRLPPAGHRGGCEAPKMLGAPAGLRGWGKRGRT